jgi:hypothetical protein
MKLLKTLTLGLLAAAGLAGTASAQTIIHIAGSTAFRAPATAAMIDVLSAGGTKTVYAGYSASSASATAILGAGSAILANGTLGSGGTATIVIETYWTGSLAGLVDLVAANNTGAYLDATNSSMQTQVNGGTATTSPYGGGALLTSPVTTTSAPDMIMSDSVKTTIASELGTGATMTAPVGSYSTISALATACGGSTVVDGGTSGAASGAGFVGIVPFEWVEGNGGSASFTNISQQAARGLLTNGFLPQSYLTGGSTSADTANYFYCVGRNEDSGTRIGALMEPQFGVTASPKQYALAGTTANLFPVTALNTEPNIVWNTVGHSGYSGGSNVATDLDITGGSISFTNGKAPENSGSSYFIGYVGVTDALAAVTGGAKALSYGGVPYSIAAVQNGQYTFWCYEHSYHLSSLSGTALTTVNAIADGIYNTDADVAGDGTHSATSGSLAAGILDNNSSPVLVFRSTTEGGPLSNY